MFRFGADLFNLSFTGSPGEFFLNPAEGTGIDDCRVVVLHIVFRPFSMIDPDSFADAVFNVGFVYDRIALVLFIGEDRLDG